MNIDKNDSLSSVGVQFNGENCLYWSYIINKKLKGKWIWSYIDRTSVKLKDKNDEVKYAKKFGNMGC